MPAANSYVVECSDTRRAPHDPAAYWVDHVCANHGSLHFRFADPPAFRARTVVQSSADHRVIDFWSDGMHYCKTAANARADGDLGNIFFVARRGVLDFEQDGERVRVQPGQGVLISKSRALHMHHRWRARGWSFDVADARVPQSMLHGPVVLQLDQGLGAVVRTMISTVSTQHRNMDSYAFSRSCATIGELLYAFMLDRGALPDTLGSVEKAVREYVAAHGCRSDVTPASIAQSLGWSVRQIQVALQRAGTTTSELIRTTRVARAADLLCQPEAQGTITDIAFASGFRSMTTFEVAFKRQFGMTPREARALCREGGDFRGGVERIAPRSVSVSMSSQTPSSDQGHSPAGAAPFGAGGWLR